MICFADIVNRFGAPADLAAAAGLSAERVKKWRTRGHSSGECDVVLVETARRLGVPLSYEELARCRVDGPQVMERRRADRAARRAAASSESGAAA